MDSFFWTNKTRIVAGEPISSANVDKLTVHRVNYFASGANAMNLVKGTVS